MEVDGTAGGSDQESLASKLDSVLAALTGRPTMTTGENAAALQALKDMGFPEARCKKALLLNNMDMEAALAWILDHIEDEDIDDPLTDEQLRQCDRLMRERAQKQNQESKEAKQKREREEMEACVAANTCTYAITGPHMYPVNEFFMCYTCGLDGSMGCCPACAQICHLGHVLHRKPLIGGTFFCDCPESGHCKCCPSEAMPSDK